MSLVPPGDRRCERAEMELHGLGAKQRARSGDERRHDDPDGRRAGIPIRLAQQGDDDPKRQARSSLQLGQINPGSSAYVTVFVMAPAPGTITQTATVASAENQLDHDTLSGQYHRQRPGIRGHSPVQRRGVTPSPKMRGWPSLSSLEPTEREVQSRSATRRIPPARRRGSTMLPPPAHFHSPPARRRPRSRCRCWPTRGITTMNM